MVSELEDYKERFFHCIDESIDLSKVEAHRFKPNGKWYEQLELDYSDVFKGEHWINIVDATLIAYKNSYGRDWQHSMHLVVIDAPYGFPLMIPAKRYSED